MSNIAKFNTIISAAKNAAREERRINACLKVSGSIYRTEQAIGNINKTIAEIEKDVAIVNFEFSEINSAHPSYADFKKRNEETNKEAEEAIAEYKKEIENLNKTIEEYKQKQQDIVDGKILMDYEAIMSRAQELISERVGNDFKAGNYDEVVA